MQLKRKTLSNFQWFLGDCLFVSGARKQTAGTWSVLFPGLNPPWQEPPCSFPKSELVGGYPHLGLTSTAWKPVLGTTT